MKPKQFIIPLFCSFFYLCSTVQSAEYIEVNQTPEEGCRYVEGEVIVKFKDNSAVHISRRAKGQFATADVGTVDATFDSLGVSYVDDLMPLTGSRVSNKVLHIAGHRLAPDRNLSKLYNIKFDTTRIHSVDEAIIMLERLPEIEYAEPNYIIYGMGLPNENDSLYTSLDSAIYTASPLISQQYGLSVINAPYLWSKPKSNKRPIIAITDTGVDIEHPDLAANIWNNSAEIDGVGGQDDDNNGYFDDIHGYNFVDNTGVITDRNGHGTHCAGIAAADGNNEIGITGANPDAIIMPLQCLDKSNSGSWANFIKAVDYATDNGADILSMSIGGYCYSQAVEEALLKAYYAGLYLVAAAGNDSKDIIEQHPMCVRYHCFPGAFKFVIGVEASDQNNNKASFSNFDSDGPIFSEYDNNGPTFFGDYYNYELRAPGVGIISTFPGGGYKYLNGTSMSTPYVAGALSRLLQCRHFSSQENLQGLLIQTRDTTTNIVNFRAAYEFDELAVDPVLVVTHYDIVDTINGGNGDGIANPGETLEIYPTIRCIYGQANGIYVSLNQGLNVDTTTLTILQNRANAGLNLSPGATIRCQTPIIAKIAERCGDGYEIQMYPTIECDSAAAINTASAFAHKLTIKVEDVVYLRGRLDCDTTLYPNKKYIVDGFFAVSPGITLTIAAGTKILLKDNVAFAVSEGSHIRTLGTPDSLIVFEPAPGMTGQIAYFRFNKQDTIRFTHFRGFRGKNLGIIKNAVLENCLLTDNFADYGEFYSRILENVDLRYTNFINNRADDAGDFLEGIAHLEHCNITHNTNAHGQCLCDANRVTFDSCNVFSNYSDNGNPVNVSYIGTDLSEYIMQKPSYLGSGTESDVRRGILDIYNNSGLNIFRVDNRLLSPDHGAHGVIWKLYVNNDEVTENYMQSTPLGVGTHRFDVVYNRPMNTSINPTISFGVRKPYTQHVVEANGCWSADSTTYTASYTITGKTMTDGVNHILVKGGKDNDGFAAIDETSRFDIVIQATGSLSTGLMATPGYGRITLEWRTDEEDFEDLMGYDLYRWTEDTIRWDGYWDDSLGEYIEAGWRFDTIQVNQNLIESQDSMYVDYNVIPGKQYYYVLKQVTTAMNSYDLSNPVVATPLTSIKGDANGSMNVDVADVVSEVNYIARQNPQPFIFEAADVNEDSTINVLDIVGTINIILHPESQSQTINEGKAYYSVENGILYIENDVVLGGVQFSFETDSATADIRILDALAPFEKVCYWVDKENYLMMAYSMSGKTIGIGKTALLQIGDADIKSIALSDAQGHNVIAIPQVSTRLDGTKYMPNSEKYIKNGNFYIRIGDHLYNAIGILVK